MIAAGLLLTSFARLQRVEPGFEPDGVFTAQLVLPPQRYGRDKLVAFYEQFYQRLAALPGSTSAALTDRVPLTGGQTPAPVAVIGRPVPPMSERAQANRHLVSPRYFSTLGIPIRAGRDFDERDSARVPHVVIVNETFARQHFPGEDPIGRTLITGHGAAAVADRRRRRRRPQHRPEHAARGRTTSCRRCSGRRRSPTSSCARTWDRRRWRRWCAKRCGRWTRISRCSNRRRSTTRIAQTVANRKLALVLLAAFAGLALVLASLGVYSVMAHLVAFRTSEIGIRMALGASPGAVMRMVLGHGRRLTLLGIALGIGGALVVTRLMQQALFEVDAADPLVYIALSVMLLLVAECASWFPARRATRIDPVIALRGE